MLPVSGYVLGAGELEKQIIKWGAPASYLLHITAIRIITFFAHMYGFFDRKQSLIFNVPIFFFSCLQLHKYLKLCNPYSTN